MVLQGSQAAAIKAITLHILLCLLVFYTVYYMIWSICCGIFRLKTFGLLTPFEFKTEPSFSSPDYLAKVLATSLTFFTSGLLFAVLLRRWVWDYAITVTLTHVLLTFAESTFAVRTNSLDLSFHHIGLECLFWCSKNQTFSFFLKVPSFSHARVMKEFPFIWQWWLALASDLLLMICSGELVTYLACSDANNLSGDKF
ncbi:putative transmembrane protein 244 isoform X2 [Pogona vitticeps]